MSDDKTVEYQRFNLTFRIQHVILFVSFLLLAFTGWALKYPEPSLEHMPWWIKLWGGAKTAGLIHRIAGVTMVADFIWHVLYLLFLLGTGKMKIDPATTIIPMPKDVADVVQNFLYFLGLSKTKPRFRRYTYLQKFDYWAVFWGMGIIGFSGLCLAFPTKFQYIFPNFTIDWIWELMGVLHSDEALLAIVFILLIHFYNEHLKWDKFPMSMLWITGKMTVEELKHEHPLEYEHVMKENPELLKNPERS